MYCDEIIAMRNGCILKTGTPEDVFTKEFIYDVFEVQTEIIRRADGRLTIIYQN